ncbi:cysteine hydrolase family protein [Geothermobacter hydrogeniphilus]|uniref:Nicotinamidase n=1 Tax=Geothermobacter hydrogeniphilus TaxID=1969733 RepID=A0A1X0XSJ9_9BACT|nr:isochorismatase family cysteine hydrolase [Geothermobacter hydrogeniphilus]ORJ55820.1 nicotinamidase [Geothermobacter hydrogeniphilus]
MRQALLVVDMLNDFVLAGAPLEVPRAREILPALRQRIAAARRDGLPVIYICDAHAADDREFSRMGWPVHAVRGTPGAEVVADLAPQTGEAVVAKTSYSGFHATDLESLLQKLDVEELVLTGCVTNICILYTAADAVMRGFHVRVPTDCVAPLDPADGDFALRQMKNVLGVDVE